jgi:hypothetical protein
MYSRDRNLERRPTEWIAQVRGVGASRGTGSQEYQAPRARLALTQLGHHRYVGPVPQSWWWRTEDAVVVETVAYTWAELSTVACTQLRARRSKEAWK